MHFPTAARLLLSVLPSLLVASCGEKEEQVLRREGEPDFVRVSDRELMDAAIAEAKSTVDRFVTALQARDSRTSGFAIKKGFITNPGDREFIWINEVELVGDAFEGRINNEPVGDVGVKLGQVVRVERDEVVDWMFLSDGRLQGGYTIAALVHGTEEQAAYEEDLGITWTQYEFLETSPSAR